MVPSTSGQLLKALPTRPPTPPREAENTGERSSFFGSVFNLFSSQYSPGATPASSIDSPNFASGASRRSVTFLERVEERDPPSLSADGKFTASKPNPRLLATSADQKPRKSILKPYNGPIPIDLTTGTNSKLLPPHAFPNLATMLESIAHQLAGKDRNSRVDAYMTLSGVLKASDNIPDIQALKDKIGLLEQFIERDMSAKNASGHPDSVLIIKALELLSSFLYKQAIADLLSAEFSAFVVDHAIKALQDKAFNDALISKDITKHLMFVMAQQKFSGKVLNADRTVKLIKAVHDIEKYVKGKSIVTGRINVYRNLLRTSRSHMVNNTEWIQDLFADMLSSIKEIQEAAIAFGLEAASQLGTESKVSRAVSEFFLRGLEDNLKYADYYAKTLKAIVEKKQQIATVPQIWSITVLFLRSRPRQFEHWAFYKPWCQILQPYFNTSDHQAKIEANFAWNRYIFAVQPDEKTPGSIIKRLAQPLLSQLRRKPINKSASAKRARQSAVSSLCTLLYYTLRPLSTSTQVDVFWDEYVIEILRLLTPTIPQQNQEMVEHDVATACAILTGLFNSTAPRPWDENRALSSDLMKANELPSLDPKWVRKNSSRVFSSMEPLLERMFWQLADDKSVISILWKTYIKSISSPAAKEIKVSLDTMGCIARIFNMLYRIWHRGSQDLQTITAGGSPEFLASISFLISTTISELGLLPFTERLLSVGQQDTFIVISTPSHRPDKSRGIVKCPLHHLVLLFTNDSPGFHCDGDQIKVVGGFVPSNFRQAISVILAPFFDARPSNKSRTDLAHELLQLLPAQPTYSSQILRRVLADFAHDSTPKLRHDDSQVEFEPIASSPFGERVLDSQLLTDRQKEVKERQQAEAAAMFPDIRSSPRTNTRSTQKSVPNHDLPIFNLEPVSTDEPEGTMIVERQTTPTMPVTDFDDFITSSPTPTRVSRGDHNVSPPSSSPEQEADVQTPDEFMYSEDIPSSPPETTDNSVSFDPSAQVDRYAVTNPSKLSTLQNAADPFTEIVASTEIDQNHETVDTPSTPIQSPSNQRRKEVLVDAVSSPPSSNRNTAEDEIFVDAISSPQQIERNRTSSLSDFDESSMIRIMHEFDKGTEEPLEQSPVQENSASAKKGTPATTEKHQERDAEPRQPSEEMDCIVVKIPKGFQVPRGPYSQRRAAVKPKRTRRSTSVASPQQSPLPETPESKRISRQVAAQQSPKLRVVIHVPPTRSSPRKRKLDDLEAAEDTSEVPDSQEADTDPQHARQGKKRKSRDSDQSLQDENETRDDEEMVEILELPGSMDPVGSQLPMVSEVEGSIEEEQPATAGEVEVPTYESIREKLRSLINDLGVSKLSREQGNELEDDFMDAKKKLYDAVATGRWRS